MNLSEQSDPEKNGGRPGGLGWLVPVSAPLLAASPRHGRAALITQLLAIRDNHPQWRTRRIAEGHAVISAYENAAHYSTMEWRRDIAEI